MKMPGAEPSECVHAKAGKHVQSPEAGNRAEKSDGPYLTEAICRNKQNDLQKLTTPLNGTGTDLTQNHLMPPPQKKEPSDAHIMYYKGPLARWLEADLKVFMQCASTSDRFYPLGKIKLNYA